MTAWRPRHAWYAPWDTGPGFMTCNGYVPFFFFFLFVVSRTSKRKLQPLWTDNFTSGLNMVSLSLASRFKPSLSIWSQIMIIVYMVLNNDFSFSFIVWITDSTGIFICWRMSCEAHRRWRSGASLRLCSPPPSVSDPCSHRSGRHMLPS